jgi:hypothetical protein
MNKPIQSEFGPDMRLVQEDEVDAVSGGYIIAVGSGIGLFVAGMMGGALLHDWLHSSAINGVRAATSGYR